MTDHAGVTDELGERSMTRLVITRGLPACGKTTRARAWVAEDPTRRARVNRDDLRQMLHAGVWLGHDTERQIISARDALIRSLLAKGLDVVCDDTNLPQRTARDLARLARLAKADLEVWDMTAVPVAVCIERDEAREGGVGEKVIRDMYTRFLNGRPSPLPSPDEPDDADPTIEPYVAVEGALPVVMVDIDGTVALHGTRSPFDETHVHEDRPNLPVIAVLEALANRYSIIYCSGRTEACRMATENWLVEHSTVHPWEALHMRPVGDTRKDAVVKREIFDREIRHQYDVVCVLDDRATVVAMWRELGLTVLQVAPGDF